MKNTIPYTVRLRALLIAALLAFSLFPAGALAAGETAVGNESELIQAVGSGEYETVRMTDDIKLSAPLAVKGTLTLDLDGHKLTASFDPDEVSDPLATVILKKNAKLIVKGGEGSQIAPPVLPEGRTDKCYGIYVNEKAVLKLTEEVLVKTKDETSYMILLLSETKLVLKDKASIKGGMFGVKIPSGTEIAKLNIHTDGSIVSGSAISKTGIPFSEIVEEDCLITADGKTVTDLGSAPDPGVKAYVFVPGAAPTATPKPTEAPTKEPDPTDTPAPDPTDTPAPDPTDTPAPDPTDTPAPDPTDTPAPDPTDTPAPDPTDTPAPDPTDTPAPDPTDTPAPDPTDTPAPTDPVQLPATTAVSWVEGTTQAMWRAVTGAEGYIVQLYLNGTDEASKCGEAVSVNDTVYDFGSLMTADGNYRFTVQAYAGNTYGAISALSKTNPVDKTPPKITSKAPVRHDAKRATFYFTSSEAGDYYFILTAANSAAPAAKSVMENPDAIHGACTAAEQAITLNRIADSSAKSIFLVIVDRAGNVSNCYKISIPAYAAPTATPSPSPKPTATPTPTDTPTPKPKTYTVSAPNGTGYSIVPVSNSKTTVEAGGSFSFTVSIQNGYTYGTGFAVKANGTALTASKGVYTVKNINADQSITVTGVVLATTPVPTAIPSSPSITTTLLPSATMGKTYSQQLTASGGTPITWSYTGSLPNGVSLTYGGMLSGTPTEEGTFRITVKASNSTGSATRQMTLVVTAAEYTVTAGANANWSKGSGESLTFTGSAESDFTVRIDGSVVPADKVTFSEDKKSVTIDASYLDTLSAGTHTLTLLYADGNAKARFNIKAAERVTAPSISAQPQNKNVAPGDDATFTVTSGGTAPLQCVWQVDKNDGSGWTDIPDADSASYTVKAAATDQNGWKYRCVITNAAGTAESNAAVLTVGEKAAADSDTDEPVKTKKTGRIILFSLLGVGVAGLGTGAYLFFRRKDDMMDDDYE